MSGLEELPAQNSKDLAFLRYSLLQSMVSSSTVKGGSMMEPRKELVGFLLLFGLLFFAGCLGPILLTEADNGTLEAIDVGVSSSYG